jgi:predicted N-formylglutamate amidohydrolase
MHDTESGPLSDRPVLLGADEPPVYELLNPEGAAPALLICDHANRAVPAALGDLGLAADLLRDHIAWDIGAGAVTRRLAARLDTPALMAGYSRLVVDCNRQPGDLESVPEVSDGVTIPGNRGLSERERRARVETFFRPYHDAVTNALARLRRRGTVPALISVHSFTPSMHGEDRPWDIGVLWNRDGRLAVPLIEMLGAGGNLRVGDNKPYSGLEVAYSINLHGGAAGLANCVVEIRHDHVETAEGAERWAGILCDALETILGQDDVHRVEHF